MSALASLKALMPQGLAWPVAVDGLTRDQTLAALAKAHDRVEAAVYQLIEEADPRTAVLMIDQWEANLGLPDPCSEDVDILAERQRRTHAKLIDAGGWSMDYFINLAATLGYTLTIEEFEEAHCESPCDVALNPYDAGWPWTVFLRLPAVTVFELDCEMGGCDEPLSWWNSDFHIECVLKTAFRRSLQTTHLYPHFVYGDA